MPIPNIRKLQDRGVNFVNFYCNVPICAPSRASVWSGRQPHNGLHKHNNITVRGYWNNYEGVGACSDPESGGEDNFFLALYSEMACRHMFAKLRPGLNERLEAWETYCFLFDELIANPSTPFTVTPNWAFDIIHEFVYGFQSFCQFRTQVSSRSEAEIDLLDNHQENWAVQTVMKYLHDLIRISGAADPPATRDSPSSSLYYLGYFAMIGLSRLECLLADYQSAVLVLKPIDLSAMDSGELMNRSFPAKLSLYYHLGFSFLMLRRFGEAINVLGLIIQQILRLEKGGLLVRSNDRGERNPITDLAFKTRDRALALLAIASALDPNNAVDENALPALKEKHEEKMALMEQGDLATYESMLQYACPKFIVPSVPDYSSPENFAHDAYRMQIKLFMNMVSARAAMPKMRSYLKLYKTIGLDKLAKFNDSDPDQLRAQLIAMKCRSRTPVPMLPLPASPFTAAPSRSASG